MAARYGCFQPSAIFRASVAMRRFRPFPRAAIERGLNRDRSPSDFDIFALLRVRAGTDVNFRTEISSPQPGGT
jgi:hypothetical protein